MVIEDGVSSFDEVFVEAALRDPTLVATQQQDGLPFEIEGECDAVLMAVVMGPQFLEVGVLGASEGIDLRPAELWAYLLQNLNVDSDRVLGALVQGFQLRRELG